MSLHQPLPPCALLAMRDICSLITDNVSIRDGVFRARAAKLAKVLDDATADDVEIVLPIEDIQLVVDMAEAVTDCLMAGKELAASAVLKRICERVVTPIAVALGQAGP